MAYPPAIYSLECFHPKDAVQVELEFPQDPINGGISCSVKISRLIDAEQQIVQSFSLPLLELFNENS